MAIVYAVNVARKPDLCGRWRRVFATPSAGAAAVVIAFYLCIAITDSIRIEQHGARVTVLDVILAPLRLQVERTYSAPFASHGFVKESRTTMHGKIAREYPRLEHGGRHLSNPDLRLSDILWRAGFGIIGGAMAWSVLIYALARLFRTRYGRGPMIASGSLCVALGFVISVAPSYHMFGTDKVGVDVLYQGLKSIRTGLVLGTLTTLISLPLAVVLGLLAGYCRGWVDDLVQYLYTTLASVPGVLLIAAAALTLDLYLNQHLGDHVGVAERADLRLFGICIILGVTGWTSLCRLLRAEVLKLRALEFVLAARSLGVGTAGIVWRHLVPNTLHIVIITSVIDLSGLVLAEAVLTYIDIGVDPSMESWGNMINSSRMELARDPIVWWSLGAAFIFMFTLVLAANVLADAVRDAFDPHLRRSR
ncbi:MAG: ABC transporter permease [Gammaproteobacteria bacterium]|nr:ABC transporter permease [Gammaproteobacteria bacterium]